MATKQKRLVDLLMEEATEEKTEKQAQSKRALFLAKKDEIEEAIRAGWKRTEIWRYLKKVGSFTASYDCFAGYVREYLPDIKVDATPKGNETFPASPLLESLSEQEKKTSQTIQPQKQAVGSTPPVFLYDPEKKADDLY